MKDHEVEPGLTFPHLPTAIFLLSKPQRTWWWRWPREQARRNVGLSSGPHSQLFARCHLHAVEGPIAFGGGSSGGGMWARAQAHIHPLSCPARWDYKAQLGMAQVLSRTVGLVVGVQMQVFFRTHPPFPSTPSKKGNIQLSPCDHLVNMVNP